MKDEEVNASTKRSRIFRKKNRKVNLYETNFLIPDNEVSRAEMRAKAKQLRAEYGK